MNKDHRDAIGFYARHFAGNDEPANWAISGLDVDGMDLVDGDKCQRVFFPEPLKDAAQLRTVLVDMAKTARQALQRE